MNRVLVIVVVYNGLRWLEHCLSSVQGADVFVVDNDSTDGSADWIQAHFPEVKLLRSAENLGFSKANNLGFEHAMAKGYDYVYLLNQDAWLEEGALEKLVAAAKEHPEYAVLSPLQYQDGYTALDVQFAKRMPSGLPEAGSLVEVPFIMAAHWLVPVKALREIGLFNENLFGLYGQDDDWCHRAHYHGKKVGVLPSARAVHDRARREEPLEKIIFRNYYTGSLVRLCDINHPLPERFCYVLLFTLVKVIKYLSVLVLKYFRELCRHLPTVREYRRRIR